jgi:hypothetical protein
LVFGSKLHGDPLLVVSGHLLSDTLDHCAGLVPSATNNGTEETAGAENSLRGAGAKNHSTGTCNRAAGHCDSGRQMAQLVDTSRTEFGRDPPLRAYTHPSQTPGWRSFQCSDQFNTDHGAALTTTAVAG